MSEDQTLEHPAHAYIRLNATLKEDDDQDVEELNHGWIVPIKGHTLSNALSGLRWEQSHYEKSAPAMKTLRLVSLKDGKDLGTLDAVDLPALRALAKPTSTRLESEEKSAEVSAEDVGLAPDGRGALEDAARKIGQTLFPGEPVKLVFSKLVVCDEGGRVARHCTTAHDDAHRGTLLIGCRTRNASEHEGGTAKLFHGPGHEADKYALGSGEWLAFRLEHAVDEVEDGAQVVLQFDIFLEDGTVGRPHTVACVAGQESADSPDADDDASADGDSDADDDNDDGNCFDESSLLVNPDLADGFSRAQKPKPTATVDAFAAKVVALLKRSAPPDAPPLAKKARVENATRNGPRTIAFLLQHVYREQNLHPDLLTGLDRAIHRALVAEAPALKVTLLPVYVRLFYRELDEEWRQHVVIAHPRAAALKRTVPAPISFVRHAAPGVKFIERDVVYPGSKWAEAKHRYFAGAMFLSLA